MNEVCRECGEAMSRAIGKKDAEIEELRCELRRLKKSNNGWWQMGRLRSGEAVYCRRGGRLAVEKDYETLVAPTKEELDEIIEMG